MLLSTDPRPAHDAFDDPLVWWELDDDDVGDERSVAMQSPAQRRRHEQSNRPRARSGASVSWSSSRRLRGPFGGRILSWSVGDSLVVHGGCDERRSAWRSGRTLDHRDQLVAAVAVPAGELGQFLDFGEDRGVFGGAGDGDRAAAAHLH